jgi:hypothetical protein
MSQPLLYTVSIEIHFVYKNKYLLLWDSNVTIKCFVLFYSLGVDEMAEEVDIQFFSYLRTTANWTKPNLCELNLYPANVENRVSS